MSLFDGIFWQQKALPFLGLHSGIVRTEHTPPEPVMHTVNSSHVKQLVIIKVLQQGWSGYGHIEDNYTTHQAQWLHSTKRNIKAVLTVRSALYQQ